MKSKFKMPIKRQNSHRLYIDSKSFLEQKLSQNLSLNGLLSNQNNKKFDISLFKIKLSENCLTKRKACYQSSKKLKPIINNNKIEQIQKQMNSPSSDRLNKNKLKQKIKHSSKSGFTLPFYMKSKFQKDHIICIDKEKHISSNDLTFSNNKDNQVNSSIKIINKITEKNPKQEIVYNSENCISITEKGFSVNNGAEKENNQDCSLIIENVCGIKNFNIYSIMDGHGSNGHLVSNYIKDKIIENFTNISYYFKKLKSKEKSNLEYPENILDLIFNILKKNDFQKIKDFYKTVDESLSSIEVRFDSNFSGSTCIILFQLGNNLISCNVGDSRAILIKENKEIIELSQDQKPENENEKKRIENMGGIVSQCNDLYDDGKIGGPFRIWIKGCDYPGIAMSRSIGDKIAHGVGVINEPEINIFNLDEKCKYIILGSDGIWQYINNMDIVDIIYEMNQEKENSIKNVCKKIINKAKTKFIENDEYVDDITISFINIQHN